MRLTFLDRSEEAARLRSLIARSEGSLGVLYGRRRCGKSRLLREVLAPQHSVYYVGDDREDAVQRSSLATEIARLLPGFDGVAYPQWQALLDRWWQEAPAGAVLAVDEFPALVSAVPELPSLVQKMLDEHGGRGLHVILTGSSQRMMQGLVLDRSAPLFGRAAEILKVAPLPAGWIVDAFGLEESDRAIEAYAVWGGTPRYWELATDHDSLAGALRHLVLSPLGVLYEEPSRLLLDDLRDTSQAASILGLIGQGCHRISEIAGRLAKSASSLSRPMQRLREMDLITREQPFGSPPRTGKRSLYRIRDPFLRFWYRFVDVDRSRLEARQLEAVERDITRALPHHIGGVWEDLARESVGRLRLAGRGWRPAQRWWGPGLDRKPCEVDVVAESEDGEALLVGEVKWAAKNDVARLRRELEVKANRLPFTAGRRIVPALWLRDDSESAPEAPSPVITPGNVLEVLR